MPNSRFGLVVDYKRFGLATRFVPVWAAGEHPLDSSSEEAAPAMRRQD
ncbi:hypothetical protein AAHH86_00105 [Candidatus Hodgkinia cicadicola]